MKKKFNPDLVSEMEWSECVLASSLATDSETHSEWVCGCGATLSIVNAELLTDTAQMFLDLGWRYNRTRTSIDAVCESCRK